MLVSRVCSDCLFHREYYSILKCRRAGQVQKRQVQGVVVPPPQAAQLAGVSMAKAQVRVRSWDLDCSRGKAASSSNCIMMTNCSCGQGMEERLLESCAPHAADGPVLQM